MYAATLGIADTLKYRPIISPSHPLVKLFDIKYVSKITLANSRAISEAQWKNLTFSLIKETKFASHNWTLNGYFQSWKYFVNVTDLVRSAFRIKSAYLDKAEVFIRTIKQHSEERTIIGIHVRRGDFLRAGCQKKGCTVADSFYIKKAIQHYRAVFRYAYFVVLSDDMRWSKANIKGPDVTFSIFREPILDMALMSLCDHMIITSGSFSWWGGWLSGGTVVYLEDYPRPGSDLATRVINENYYPPQWIGMSNGEYS